MAFQRIAIIGFGGFARELAWLIDDLSKIGKDSTFICVGHVVSEVNKSKLDKGVNSAYGLLGDINWLEQNRSAWDALAIGIGAPVHRHTIFESLSQRFPDAAWPALIHPTVHLDFSSAQIGPGTIICANVIGTVNLKIEQATLVNLSCTLGHEVHIKSGSVINPSVNLSGGVTIGQRVLVGTGAQVLQNISIGDDATVGAGAVVTKNVASATTVVGVPAKPLANR